MRKKRFIQAHVYIYVSTMNLSHAYFNAFIFISFIILQYTIIYLYETTMFIFKAILYTFCNTSTATGFTFFRDASRSKFFIKSAR